MSYANLIGGEWVAPATERYEPCVNPADTREVLGHFPRSGAADATAAIDAAAIAKMKDGVRLVNAARGELVDEDALLDALASGKVAAAALDVFGHEPYTGPLLQEPNVVVTPHLAASTDEAQDRAGVIAAILETEPKPISQLRPMVPPALDRVICTCPAQDPEEPWQNGHDVATELGWIAYSSREAAARHRWRDRRCSPRGAHACGARSRRERTRQPE